MLLKLQILFGTNWDYAYNLRPIIEIDLKSSGYNLEKIEDESGNISFRLNKK